MHKQIIKVSKPSKKDKKYSYYTDILDENGNINENKIITRNKLLSPQSTKSQRKKLIFDSTSIDSSIKKAKTITSHSNDDNTIKEKIETENKKEDNSQRGRKDMALRTRGRRIHRNGKILRFRPEKKRSATSLHDR